MNRMEGGLTVAAVHGAVPFLPEALLFLAIAGLVIPLLQRWRVSQVLAFLTIGAVLGPNGLGGWVAHLPWLRLVTFEDPAGVRTLAELGVVFLLFTIGLELPAERLWKMRRWVFGIGGLQIALSALPIGLLAHLFGNDWQVAAVLGIALAFSSTAIVMQLLAERRAVGTPVGRACFAVLLMQDLVVIPLLILVGLLGTPHETGFAGAVGAATAKAAVALALIYFLGRRLVQPLFRHATARRQPDTFTALTLLVTLGTAALTWAAGLSMALGAFLAGLLLAETAYRHEIQITIEPFKGLMLGLFFIGVGMGVDLRALLLEPFWIPSSVLGLLAIKSAVVYGLLRLAGMSLAQAAEGAFLLGSGSEFAFIVLGVALAAGVLEPPVAHFMLLVVSFSMLCAPLSARLGRVLARRQRRAESAARPVEAGEAAVPELADHVLVLGFGRVGQLLAQVLEREALPWLALDLDAANVARRHAQGLPVFYGDASHRELLRQAGAARAQAVVVTLDQMAAAEAAVRVMREEFPHVPVVARARDDGHARALRGEGATVVTQETLESGLQLAGQALEQIGFPAEAASLVLQQVRAERLAALDPAPAAAQ